MPIPGADYLGGAKYQSAIVAEHVPGGAAGIFLNTFGDATNTIRALCPNASEIVVHLAPFDSTHSYPLKEYLNGVLRDAKRLERVAKNCNAIIMLSPFCEHNHSKATMQKVLKAVQKVAPSTVMVNSIWRGAVIPGVITEIHLPARIPKGEYTVSLDGNTGPVDFSKYRKARHFRWWTPQMNGKAYATENTPIANRKHYPTRADLRIGWQRLIYHLRGLL